MHIHYVIPAYRESKRLPGFLNQLLPQLQQSPLKLTVQIVDDGSGIDEQDLLSRFIISKQSDFPFLLPPILNPVNQGKGTAVHSGWKSAPECDLIGFVDADGSISPQELLRFTELAIQQPGACHFASRIKMMGRKIQRSELRHYIGRIYATLVGMSLKIPVYDSQCGLKILPRSVYQKMQNRFIEPGFAFDVELLVLCIQQGIPVNEIAIDWHDAPGSKVNVLRDSLKMALAVSRIKQHHIFNPNP